jgi:serine/threonine-protein kinase
MSPEQVRSAKNVDPRSDIWALGVVLYEVLTGLPPFMADTLSALSAMITSDTPRRPIQRRGDLPPGVDEAVMRCLEKQPEQRPQSIAEVAELLAPYVAAPTRASIARIRSIDAAARAPTPEEPRPSLPSAGAIRHRDTNAAWGTTQSRRERKRSVLLGVAVGALVFSAGLFGWAVVRTLGSRPPAVSAPAPPVHELEPALPITEPLVEASPPVQAVPRVTGDAGSRTPPRSARPRRAKPRPAQVDHGALDDRF